MIDETQMEEGDFDDVVAEEGDVPLVDEYRLSTRPGVVSGAE